VPIFSDGRLPVMMGYRAPLASGDPGTAQTIKVMRRLIDQDLATSSFVNFARNLVRNVPSHDELSEVEALYDWVHQNIRFVKDPVTKEAVMAPSDVLRMRQGDCEESASLMGGLALAIGYPARLVTVAAQPSAPDEFSHVYAEIEVPPGSNNWVAADAARPHSQFGVHPPEYYRRRAWSLTDDSYEDLSGTRMRGLGAWPVDSQYIRYRTLGQDDGDGSIDWGSIISQGLTETPQMMAIASGQGTKSGILQTSPYGSFATPYTPGYGIPGAGYPTTLTSPYSTTPDWLMPLLIGGIALVILLPEMGHHS
jgi:hypothetical protein